MEYDVIGDVHGQAGKLKALLRTLGYTAGAVWTPPAHRQAIFLGDLIDRGPEQVEVVRIVRGMIDAGHARSVMGNHELNAIGYATPKVDETGEFLRPHSPKNRHQHQAFLNQVGEGSVLHREMVGWFKTLPVALDLGGIRVVHAWWNQSFVDRVAAASNAKGVTDERFLLASFRQGSPEFQAMEGLTKGLEIALPAGYSFFDHDGMERRKVRTRWWLEGQRTYRDIAIVPPEVVNRMPELPVPQAELAPPRPGAPVFVGHYWLTGAPQRQSATVACLDYSAARSGPLVGYRWQGESTLDNRNFIVANR